jgi:hypothetical protein
MNTFEPTAELREESCELDGTNRYVVDMFYRRAGVDRPRTYGISFSANPNGRKLADRLVAAVNAGVVLYDATIKTDINGRTYVCSTSRVMGKYANADLKKLGF